MGAAMSKKKKKDDDMSLRKRAERRYETYGYPAADAGSTDVVQTADKYDFLLVFRDPEDAGKSVEEAAGGSGAGAGDGGIFSPLINAVSPGSLGVFSDETLSGACVSLSSSAAAAAAAAAASSSPHHSSSFYHHLS